jgi:hypothetical protein
MNIEDKKNTFIEAILKLDEFKNLSKEEKTYFENQILPSLNIGLNNLAQERPHKQIEYLAYYLLKVQKKIP